MAKYYKTNFSKKNIQYDNEHNVLFKIVILYNYKYM